MVLRFKPQFQSFPSGRRPATNFDVASFVFANRYRFMGQIGKFLRSQRLYQEDDTGERQYLSEEETMAARARVEEQIQEYCGS